MNAMTEAATMTKGEFAAMMSRSAGRVSQWIKAGIIGPEALDGEGRAARIIVETAKQHLRARLDPAQRVGLNAIMAGQPVAAQPQPAKSNAESLLPEDPVPPETAQRGSGQASAPSALPVSDPVSDPVAGQIAREKLRQAQMQTARMEREERVTDGTYMDAAEARAAIAKASSMTVTAIEAGLPEMANAIAARFGVPVRDVQHELGIVFRRIREEAAVEFRNQAAARDALVLDGEQEDIEEQDED